MESIFVWMLAYLVSLATINNCCGSCDNYCKNNGYCDVIKDRCICPPGYSGSTCSTRVLYMIDECSRTIDLNSDSTLVLKSQSSRYMPSSADCDLKLRAENPYESVLVTIVKFNMHYDCSRTSLQIGDNLICDNAYYRTTYTSNQDEIHLHLKLNYKDDKDQHMGFIVTISSFSYGYYVAGQFTCTNWRVISPLLFDNGFNDCGDNSDEPDAARTCFNSLHCNKECIPYEWTCDCNADCNDLTDEWGCSCPVPVYGVCAVNQFWCESTKSCLSNSLRCDGTKNCANPVDERGCISTPVTNQCKGTAHLCKNTFTCIPQDYVCDGYLDCSDGSDEDNCNITGGVLTGIILASLLSVICFAGAVLLIVSIIVKKRRTTRRNNIRTVSAYVPPEPQNLFTNCDIPPSYEIAVGIDGSDVTKEDIAEEDFPSQEENDHIDEIDDSLPNKEFINDSHDIPLLDAVSDIAKTLPPKL